MIPVLGSIRLHPVENLDKLKNQYIKFQGKAQQPVHSFVLLAEGLAFFQITVDTQHPVKEAVLPEIIKHYNLETEVLTEI